MTEETLVDAIVVGMGPGGEEVAGRLAEAGLEVIGIDAHLLGGECPYWGCVPSKMMIRASNLLAEARRVPGMAGEATVTPDWAPVAARIRDEATDDWDDAKAIERFEGKGGTFVRGHGRFVSADVIRVGEHAYRARRAVVVATGSSASTPPIDGIAGTPYWTNHEAIEVERLPTSLIVLGGGAIGAELAQMFSRFGVSVSVVEAAERLIPLDEPEAGQILADVFAREGIEVVTGVGASAVAHDGGEFAVALADRREMRAAQLLVATGRKVDLDAFGAGVLGVDVTAKSLPVDESLRVADGVWAVGDVTGKGAFTHVAMYQARIAVASILGNEHEAADYRAVPRVTFTDPEIGAVGMTEAQAREAGLRVGVGSAQVASTARGWMHKAGNDGLIKLVADLEQGVLVGATSMGPHGGEVLGLLTLAVHAKVALTQLRSMIYAYPTFHRGVEDALRDLVT